MEEGFSSLSKNISKCVELLSQSMKGNNVEQKLGTILDNNRIYYLKEYRCSFLYLKGNLVFFLVDYY